MDGNSCPDDPIVVILDDFAGTGATLRSGLLRSRAQIDSHVWNEYMANGRISVFLMYCFPEAIDQIRNAVCGIHVVAANTLSVELRTCSEQAEILESPGDLRFARDVLLQAFSFSSVRT